jgi:hypothetical protein
MMVEAGSPEEAGVNLAEPCFLEDDLELVSDTKGITITTEPQHDPRTSQLHGRLRQAMVHLFSEKPRDFR